MKAIETVYKGYRFRSRLEARWAVYLDVIGWQWEYEPEGFEFDDGTRYLPDFKVNCSEPFWIEVKATQPTFEEKRKASLLVSGSKLPLIWAIGLPEPIAMASDLPLMAWDEDTGIVVLNGGTIDAYCFTKWNRIGWGMGELNEPDAHTTEACIEAKKARFEFGERGGPIVTSAGVVGRGFK